MCIEDWFQGKGKEGDRLNGREVCGVNDCNRTCCGSTVLPLSSVGSGTKPPLESINSFKKSNRIQRLFVLKN